MGGFGELEFGSGSFGGPVLAPTPVLSLDGQDRTEYVKVNSCSLTRDLNGRSTMRFVIEDRGRGFVPETGLSVVLSVGGTKRFAGHVHKRTALVHPGTSYLQFALDCRDYHHVLARRLLTAEYPAGSTVYDIVQDIAATALYGEGLTYAAVENPGATITEALKFTGVTVQSALDRISALTGLMYYIDFERDFHMSEFVSNPAPFNLSDDSGNWSHLTVERTLDGYRNRQHLRSEFQVASEHSETKTVSVDGQIVVPTEAVTRSVTSILVNGVSKTHIGIGPNDTVPSSGYGFYYFTNGSGILARDIVLQAGDEVEINYTSAYSNVVSVEDEDEQAVMAGKEGGSGIWEAIEDVRGVDSFQVLRLIGLGRLRQFGHEPVIVRFQTIQDGLQPGQRIGINLTAHELTLSPESTFLIERVDSQWVAARPDFMRHTVQATSGEPRGRPIDFYRRLVEMARIGADPQAISASTDVGRYQLEETPY